MEFDRWDYGDAFQIQVLGLCLRDPHFLPRYADVIDFTYFEQQDLSNLAMILLRHFKKTGEVPRRDTMVFMVREWAKKYDRDGSEGLENRLHQFLSHCYNKDLDEDFIASRIVRFGRRQAMRVAMYESVDLLQQAKATDDEDDSVEKIVQKIEHAGQKGTTRDFGLKWHDVALELPHLLQTSVTAKSRVPTYVERIDKLLDGGPGAGELAVVLGPPNKGKSTFLCCIGAAGSYHLSSKARLNNEDCRAVVHITCEMTEIATMAKYGAAFSGLAINDVKAGVDDYVKIVEPKLTDQAPLYVKRFLPGKTSVNELRWFIANLVVCEGVDVGLVIVDYADRLKGGEDDRFRGMGTIYDGLIEIGVKFECPVWTGSQVRRFNALDEEIDQTGVAESWKKVEACDIMVSLNQKQCEYEDGVARLNFTKVRDGVANKIVPVKFQQSHCLLRGLSEDEIKEQKKKSTDTTKVPGSGPPQPRDEDVVRDLSDLDAQLADMEEQYGGESDT